MAFWKDVVLGCRPGYTCLPGTIQPLSHQVYHSFPLLSCLWQPTPTSTEPAAPSRILGDMVSPRRPSQLPRTAMTHTSNDRDSPRFWRAEFRGQGVGRAGDYWRLQGRTCSRLVLDTRDFGIPVSASVCLSIGMGLSPATPVSRKNLSLVEWSPCSPEPLHFIQ